MRLSRFFRALAVLGFALLLQPRIVAADAADAQQLMRFYGLPELVAAKLSPKGDLIGLLVGSPKGTAIGLYDLQTGGFRLISQNLKLQPLEFWWKADRTMLVRVAEPEYRGQNFATLDCDGKVGKALWGVTDIGTVLDPLPEDPEHVLMVLGGSSPSVVKADMRSGKTTTVEESLPGVETWLVDGGGNLRAASTTRVPDGRITWWKAPGAKVWQKFHSPRHDEFIPLGFDADPRWLYVQAAGEGDERAVVRVDTVTGAQSVVYRRPGCDPTYTLRFGNRGTVIGVGFDQEEKTFVHPLAAATEAPIKALATKFDGFHVEPIGPLARPGLWLVNVTNSRNPGTLLLCDTTNGNLALIGNRYGTRLKEEELVPAERVPVINRQGLNLSAWVWRKPSTTNAPLVIMLPNRLQNLPATDEYDNDVQALVSSGFAVAKINTRGTYGFGRKFANATDRNVVGVVREDIEDAVSALQKLPELPGRPVVLFGERMGGALALAVAASSNRFAAVVNINGTVESTSAQLLAVLSYDNVTQVNDQLGWKEGQDLAKQLSVVNTLARWQRPTLNLYDESESAGAEADDLKRVARRTGVPAKFDVAYPYVRQGRAVDEVRSDRARIMTKVASFLNELGTKKN